jgi:cytochrome c oxidase subunit II
MLVARLMSRASRSEFMPQRRALVEDRASVFFRQWNWRVPSSIRPCHLVALAASLDLLGKAGMISCGVRSRQHWLAPMRHVVLSESTLIDRGIGSIMVTRMRATIAAASLSSMAWVSTALAAQPTPWQIDMQPGVTPVAERMYDFNILLLVTMTAIMLFVMGLLLYVMFKFNAKANPVPSHTHHNSMLEVAWTVIPVLILVVIAIPSFKDLYFQYSFPKADVTIKATAHQWYWSYEYPDTAGVAFDANMLDAAGIEKMKAQGLDAPRLLAVDNDIVVPVNKVVHMLITSGDVLHNWTVPAFGVKTDAVPGRLVANWFKATKTGAYYGPCSELCGTNHAYMPIAVRVVPEDVYAKWLEARKAGGKDADQKAFDIIRQAALDEKKALAVADAKPAQ